VKLHSVEEVIDDIKRSCGLDITLGDIAQNAKFVNLYSDFFPSPPDTATVDEFKKSVMNFLNHFNNVLACCDIWPTDEHVFYLYKVNTSGDGNIFNTKLSLIGVAETKENILKLLDSDAVVQEVWHICIVNTRDSEVYYFDRQQSNLQVNNAPITDSVVNEKKLSKVDFDDQTSKNNSGSEKLKDAHSSTKTSTGYLVSRRLH
jgi:hypothetical protein